MWDLRTLVRKLYLSYWLSTTLTTLLAAHVRRYLRTPVRFVSRITNNKGDALTGSPKCPTPSTDCPLKTCYTGPKGLPDASPKRYQRQIKSRQTEPVRQGRQPTGSSSFSVIDEPVTDSNYTFYISLAQWFIGVILKVITNL